jgi:hypothetical protein
MVTWLPHVAAQRSLVWAPLTVRMFQREALVSTRPHRFRYARRNIPHTLHYITSTGVRRRSYLQDVAHAAYRLAVTVQYAGQSAYTLPCHAEQRDTSSGRASNNNGPVLACTSHVHLMLTCSPRYRPASVLVFFRAGIHREARDGARANQSGADHRYLATCGARRANRRGELPRARHH